VARAFGQTRPEESREELADQQTGRLELDPVWVIARCSMAQHRALGHRENCQ
jgi:hypothetical protein